MDNKFVNKNLRFSLYELVDSHYVIFERYLKHTDNVSTAIALTQISVQSITDIQIATSYLEAQVDENEGDNDD